LAGAVGATIDVRPGGLAPAEGAVLVLGGPLVRADLPGVCARLRRLLERTPTAVVFCDVSAVPTDVVLVEALARLQLTARRRGAQLRVRGASCALQQLIAFVGLSGVLPLDVALGVEPSRQAEQREQSRGVQERVEPGDAVP
jgi:ABC-type transporter Mla MlaB component